MRGFTLLELMVVLALLGILLAVSGLSLGHVVRTETTAAEHARAEAIKTGIPQRAESVLFLPDGRAIGTRVDPLTGEARAQ